MTTVSNGIRETIGQPHRPAWSTCDRADCDNLGLWRVGLRIWRRGERRSPATGAAVRYPYVICGECKPKINVRELVHKRAWDNICEGLAQQGYRNLDRASAQFEFKPLLLEMIGMGNA